MFESPGRLALGLVAGMFFGLLLQKGRVAKFSVILGQLLLRDWTVAKIMASAIAVGSIGVYAAVHAGHSSLHVKPFLLGGVIGGGVLFGAGMAILGYCPGTSVAACGEGRRDAMAGVAGMCAGALLFVAAFRYLEPLISLGNFGSATLPDLTGSSPWAWIALINAFVLLSIFVTLRKKKRSKPLADLYQGNDEGESAA